jgi:hypothetical protein
MVDVVMVIIIVMVIGLNSKMFASHEGYNSSRHPIRIEFIFN